MQFSAITISALFAALVSAGPLAVRSTKDITINSFDVRNIDSTIQAASLNIQPDNVNCSGTAPIDEAANSSCDVDGWSFQIKSNTLENYQLSVYKQTGQASGMYSMQNVTLICHAGGSSATDFECDQPAVETISMTLS